MSNKSPRYKRILLKLSGEALMGSDAYGINRQTISGIVAEIKVIVDMGVQVGVVIGGGNIFPAGATSFAVLPPPRRAWTGLRQTTWGCWRR